MRVNEEWLAMQYKDPDTGKPLDPTSPGEDAYVLGILRVGEKVLDLIDALEGAPIDADALVHQANKELDEGITGNMAGYVAMIATKCSDRGEEFKKSWNTSLGKPDASGVLNPAIINIG